MSKKILFVGAGAIGSYLGAFLSRAGHDVTLVDPWAEQVETVRRQGIAVTGPHDPFTARPKIVHLHEAQRLDRDFDAAFVAMKVYDTAWATQLALRHVAPSGVIVSSQNCWPDPIAAAVAGAGRCLGLVMSKIGVALWTPGQVERGVEKGAGKGHDVFRVGEHDGRAITIHLAGESARVGLALGYKVPKFNGEAAERWADSTRRETYQALDEMLTPKTASTRNWKASMAQDVTKGRPTEIDYMNGHVVAQGRAKGVPTPVSSAVVEVMHEVESGARKPAPENIGAVLKRAGL